MINKINLHKGIRKTICILFIIVSTHFVTAQTEFSKWYFGSQAGLDFSTSPPTVLTNGSLTTVEGCATICDNTGNLLFYTDGLTIYNSAHTVMANGTGLGGHSSSTQSGIIVKQPGNANLYYVFTTPLGFCYSIVDMNLAAGMGSVTVKNVTLSTSTCEKQVAVRHCNGKDVWLVSHEYGTNQFHSFLLNTVGVNTNTVISAIGPTITISGAGGTTGHLKISPDGKKLAMATGSNSAPASLGLGGFYLFDFDAATGAITNSLLLTATGSAYGLEFSADGSKLYGSTSPYINPTVTSLFQWNICAGSSTAITASQYSLNLGSQVIGAMQRAIDGRIYIASNNQTSLSVIYNPNGTGASMNFSLNAISIAPKASKIGLPNYINPYTKPALSQSFSTNIQCQNVTFTVPPSPTFTSGCVSTPYAPNGYMWDFGEPASGSANSSTLSSPNHLYSGLGTYTVSLILVNPCGNDTLKQVINVTTAGPNPDVAGTFTICKGERYTYTASGGSSYLWSNNSTATAVPLNPTQTTVYSVASTSNGCTLSKSFAITVNACLGVVKSGASSSSATGIHIYPNPVKSDLFIESETAAQLYIFDNTGTLVLEVKLNAGQNTINTANLPAGFYNLKAQGKAGNWHGRIVKGVGN